MNLQRREPVGGWAAHPVERVPLRDSPESAPACQRDRQRVVRPADAIPVKVWLTQRQTGEFEANGFAVGWTDRQVLVNYTDPHGREGAAWVWSSAVTRR